MAKVSPDQIKNYYDQICQLSQPEDVFGDLGITPNQQLVQLEIAYKDLIRLYHPDQFANRKPELQYATEITKRLNDFKKRALLKIKSSHYGDRGTDGCINIITTEQREYYVTGLLAEGALADIYRAYFYDPDDSLDPRKDVVIKIIADPIMNGLVRQEIDFYQQLSHFCFPTYIENFATSTGKLAVVVSYIAEGYDLIELTGRYRQQNQKPGLPQEHMVWILDRFLAALGLLHEHGILHGNIQPDNLIVQPKTHNGVLIDFLHCRIRPLADEVFSIVNPEYCAPEVLTGRFKPHPVSDIHALGCCMIEMLGGSRNLLDDSLVLHPFLRQFLQKMTQADPARRAGDAWALSEELKILRQQIFGANRRFLNLEIGG